jgi:hypothetical protein
MKLLYCILISALILIPSFSYVVVYFTFKVNQDEIARTLCVKKEVINNNCNGKCYLEKQLKKIEGKHKESSLKFLENLELICTQIDLEFIFSEIVTFKTAKKIVFKCCDKPKRTSFSIFHPPLV